MKNNDNGMELIRKQYAENEWKTNRAIGLINLGFVVICMVTQLLLFLDYSYGVAMVNKYVYIPLCVMNVVFYAVAWWKKFRAPWIKHMLMTGVIITSVGLFALFTTYMSYFVLLPFLISTRYFNKRFIHRVSAATVMLFLAACVANYCLEPVSPTVQLLHENACYNSWTYYLDTITYIVVPMLLTAVFVAAYSLNTSNMGRKLLQRQGESAGRIAAVETELKMAADIQKSALPAENYICPGGNFSISAHEEPAKEVGGDFYDYFMVNDHDITVLIADVSDKGAAAAMFMMSAKKAIQCAVQCCHDLNTAIELANRLICQDNKSDMFLTLWLGIIDTRSGMGKYINAGHLPPVIKHADGTVERITNEPDMFLGSFPDMVPSVHSFSVSAGDVLLLYTDGISDAMNAEGKFFGTERVIETLKVSDGSAVGVTENMMQGAKSFAGDMEQFDDMTLLALQCSRINDPTTALYETTADEEGTKTVIDGVNALLTEYACPDDVRRNAAVVTDEICANIADYAYDGDSGEMRVETTVGENYITLTFIDSGMEFDPLAHADPELPDEPLIGGLGIFFVKNLVDEISYARTDNKNRLSVRMIWGI